MLGLVVVFLTVLRFTHSVLGQPSGGNNAPCIAFCSHLTPDGTPVDCPSAEQASWPVGICVCTGSDVVRCVLCGTSITDPAVARNYCHDGPAPSTVTTTTTSQCPTSTPEPIGVPGQIIPASLLDKFNDASKLASIAYCISGAGIGGNIQCDRFCCDFPDMFLVDYFEPLLTQGLKGFIGRDDNPMNQRIVISFRGTNFWDPNNIASDLGFASEFAALLGFIGIAQPIQVAASGISDLSNCSACNLHPGFANLASLALKHAKQKIIELHTQYSCYKIEVIGHSLGGAVAEIFGTVLTQLGMDVTVTTLAAPRVGDPAWASFVDTQFSGETNNYFYRITHSGDLIPHLAPEIYKGHKYRHPATEYWITNDLPQNPSVITCTGDEDPTCSDSEESFLLNKVANIITTQNFVDSLIKQFLKYNTSAQQQQFNNLITLVKGFEAVIWNDILTLRDAHTNYFYTLLGACDGACGNRPQAPTCTLTGPSPAYAQANQYCRTLCGRVCQSAEICNNRPDLQQALNDICFAACTCDVQGLALGGNPCNVIRPSGPGLVFCYTDPACPATGHYFNQADLVALGKYESTPGGCPFGDTVMLTGY